MPGKNGKERSGKVERNVAVRQSETQQSGVTRPSRAAQQDQTQRHGKAERNVAVRLSPTETAQDQDAAASLDRARPRRSGIAELGEAAGHDGTRRSATRRSGTAKRGITLPSGNAARHAAERQYQA